MGASSNNAHIALLFVITHGSYIRICVPWDTAFDLVICYVDFPFCWFSSKILGLRYSLCLCSIFLFLEYGINMKRSMYMCFLQMLNDME